MSVSSQRPASLSASHGHSQCLLCGELNPRSLHLSFQAAGDGAVKTRFQAGPGLQGYAQFLHGGVIAAILDSAMTHCLFHKGIRAVTGDLQVRFLRPIACQASLEIRAWVLSSYPPLYRLKAEITVDEILMAWAEAKFLQCTVQ